MDDLSSYSSSVGRAVFHLCFKAKYSHKVFENKQVEQRCKEIFQEVASLHRFSIQEIGFDKDHVHLVVDVGLKGIAEIAKLLKGTSGYKLLHEFPWLKREYFWDSGLWSPATFFDSLGRNVEEVSDYVKSQQYH